MSFFYHRVFKFEYSLRQTTGEWFAQDEFRAHGLAKERTTGEVHYLAPSEATARAHFDEKLGSLVKSNELILDKVTEIRLDAVLVSLELT